MMIIIVSFLSSGIPVGPIYTHIGHNKMTVHFSSFTKKSQCENPARIDVWQLLQIASIKYSVSFIRLPARQNTLFYWVDSLYIVTVYMRHASLLCAYTNVQSKGYRLTTIRGTYVLLGVGNIVLLMAKNVSTNP